LDLADYGCFNCLHAASKGWTCTEESLLGGAGRPGTQGWIAEPQEATWRSSTKRSDVGAIWAAVIEQNLFTVEAPGIEPLTAGLGEDAQCFRGTITIAGRKPIRHFVAISAELAKTRPGTDPGGRRTILCDNDPTFVLYRIAQRFGLPVVPEWAGWFNEEINRRGAIKSLIGLGCAPVLVSGTKKLFLKWIRLALRQKRIAVPDCNGPVRWSLDHSFFIGSENTQREGCCETLIEECPAFPSP
jgi:hypothetical protein